MISDADNARLSELAFKALDAIKDEYGEDADLGDAVLIFEAQFDDPDEEGERLSSVHYCATTDRTVVHVGLAEVFANSAKTGWQRPDA